MKHSTLLAITTLALASCQSASPWQPPAVVGEDLAAVAFHGRLSMVPEPLEPRPAAGESVFAGTSGEIRVDIHVLSVPRASARALLGVKPRRQARSSSLKARAQNARPVAAAEPDAGLESFPPYSVLAETHGAFPVQWWGPQGMRVPAAAARQALKELEVRVRADEPTKSHFARRLTFYCDAGAQARVAATQDVAFVESFRFEDDRKTLAWEPCISTAERGFSLALQPEEDDGALSAEFRLQVRDVVGMPVAHSRITGAYLHGSRTSQQGVTLQAPLFSDHVFEGRCTCGEGQAYVLFATNATAEDEVLIALVEMRPRGSSQ